MKRPLLWAANVALLMILSAAWAAPTNLAFTPLSATELASVTGGICQTCKKDDDDLPVVESERWELVGRRNSTPTVTSRSPVQTYFNPHAIDMKVSLSYSDDCRRIITGGSASFARSIGLSLDTVYHCNQTHDFSFAVPPKSTVTLYRGTMRYYTTYTYHLVLYWSDGYAERTGLQEVIREETTYGFMEVR